MSCKMLVIKLLIDSKNSRQFLKSIFCYDATKLKKMVKFYVPSWTLFAGPVTFYSFTVG